MKYEPKPIDVSDTDLPGELSELKEHIAQNVHEVWAQARFQEGWRFGPERNDRLKETSCLVPYGELPESEKEYDRILAANVIKLILKLGYEIRKPES